MQGPYSRRKRCLIGIGIPIIIPRCALDVLGLWWWFLYQYLDLISNSENATYTLSSWAAKSLIIFCRNALYWAAKSLIIFCRNALSLIIFCRKSTKSYWGCSVFRKTNIILWVLNSSCRINSLCLKTADSTENHILMQELILITHVTCRERDSTTTANVPCIIL